MSHFGNLFGMSSFDSAWLQKPYDEIRADLWKSPRVAQYILNRMQDVEPDDQRPPEEVRERAVRQLDREFKTEHRFFQDLVREKEYDGLMRVYRVVALDKISDLRTEGIGVYWSYDKDCSTSYWAYGSGNDYIIHGRVHIDDVNWLDTILLHVQFGPGVECEIRLMPKAPVELEGWSAKDGGEFNPLPVSRGTAGLFGLRRR